MKRIFSLIWCIITISFILSSCAKDLINNASQSLTGVFSKEEIVFDESFQANSSIVVEGNELFFIGKNAVDDELNTSIITILNIENMNISYEKIPGEGYNALAVSNGRYLLLNSLFNSETFQMEYTLKEVSMGITVWEKQIEEIMIIPDNYWGGVYITSANEKWYIGVGTSLAVLTNGGIVENTEEFPSEIIGLKKDAYDRIHVLGREYHKIIDENGSFDNVESLTTEVDNLYFTKSYDYCYTNENGLYGFSNETGIATEIMNWTNSGIVFSRGVNDLVVVSPETIYIYGSDGVGGKTGLWKYTKADDIDTSDLEIIRIAYMEDGRNQVPLAAVKFNSAQSQYRIVCEELSSAYSGTDQMNSFDKAILSKDIADIVVTQDFDSLKKYGEKGIFTNLYTLMDTNLSEDDVFGCVRKACEINGKLYGLPREFSLDTYVANPNTIDSKSWDLEKFIEFADSMPDGKSVILTTTQNDVYNELRDSMISECVDFENNICSFNSRVFMHFVEYISSLPQENTEQIDRNVNNYINGNVGLFHSDINSYASYYQIKSVFGEKMDADIVGYPSSEGGALKFISREFFSIAEASNVKEGAMEFLRYLLSEDCVIDEMRGMRSIPSLKTTAKAWDESESQMYYYFYYDNVGQWSADTKMISQDEEGVPGVCVQLTQEKIDEVYDFLDHVNVFPYIPSDIKAIVDEEMSVFLGSSKTAEETAEIIQSRVSIYLSEKE